MGRITPGYQQRYIINDKLVTNAVIICVTVSLKTTQLSIL